MPGIDFVPDAAQPSTVYFEPDINPDAARVGAAPSPEDLGIAPANYTSPAKPGPVVPDVSRGKAFARGAVAGGTLGLFSLLNAAADQAGQKLLPQPVLDFLQQHGGGGEGLPVNEPHTFAERRAAYQGLLHQAQAAHPGYYMAGEAVGTLAAPVPGAGAAGEVAGKLGTKVGGKIIGGLAKAGTEAGITGTVYGAGQAAGEGQDLSGIGQGAKTGLELGSLTGTALHGATGLTGLVAKKALQSLSDKYVQLFGAEVVGGVAKKATKQQFAQLANREDEAGIKAARDYIKSKDLAPVEQAAAGQHYDEALDRINQVVQKMSPQRQANYAQVSEALPFRVGDGEEQLRRELYIARNSGGKGEPLEGPLQAAWERWKSDFSTADAGQLQRTLLHPPNVSTQAADELTRLVDALPQTGLIGRDQILAAVKSENIGPEALAFLDKNVTNKDTGILRWNPDATTNPLNLRAEATTRAASASSAFDALSPQYSQARKEVISKAINKTLEQYLDKAAATSQETASAVKRIRSDDVKWSVLLNAKSGLEQRRAKQLNNMLTVAPPQLSKVHGTTLLGAGLWAGNKALQSGIRNAPRLQEALQNLPPTSGLASALSRLGTRTAIPAPAQVQSSAQPTGVPEPLGSTNFGTGQ